MHGNSQDSSWEEGWVLWIDCHIGELSIRSQVDGYEYKEGYLYNQLSYSYALLGDHEDQECSTRGGEGLSL